MNYPIKWTKNINRAYDKSTKLINILNRQKELTSQIEQMNQYTKSTKRNNILNRQNVLPY